MSGGSKRLKSGHLAEVLTGREREDLARDFPGYTQGLARLSPGGWIFQTDFTKWADAYYNFKFRKSDVVVLTSAKCGTTWMQELVWTMRNSPNLDNPLANQGRNVKAPFLDFDFYNESKKVPPVERLSTIMAVFNQNCPGGDPKDGVFLQLAQNAPDPRTIKTHLPFSLLTPDILDTAKVVYVARDPKDVALSYYHHSRLFKYTDYTGTLDQFVQYFVDDKLVYNPYWLHLKEAAQRRHHPNLHIVYYENLKNNNMEELRRLDQFLGTNLTQEQLQKVAHYTSFREMKTRGERGDSQDGPCFNQHIMAADGGFYRKGESGSWKESLSPDQVHRINQWSQRYVATLDLPPHSWQH